MIEFCLERVDQLSDWEQEFIEGLSELSVNANLSEPRLKKLEEIYNKL